MNIIGQIDPSAFAMCPRTHHRITEPIPEFPSSAGSRARGLLALKACNWSAAKKSQLTARDYVQDGLIHMWDGVENAGWGVHDETATTWVDLVGSLALQLGGNVFSADCVVFSGSGGIVTKESAIVDKAGHMEVAVTKVGNSDADIVVAGAWFLNIFVMSDYVGKQKYIQFANYDIARVPVDSVVDVHGMSAEYNGTAIPPHCYANGNEVEKDGTENGWNAPSGLSIGCTAASPKYYPFHGKIHNIRIYSRALTAAEVAANYAVDQARFFAT